MAKEEKPKSSEEEKEPDADFFAAHPDLTDDDKSYLRAAWLKRKYIAHRESKEKPPKEEKPKGGGMFGGRTR